MNTRAYTRTLFANTAPKRCPLVATSFYDLARNIDVKYKAVAKRFFLINLVRMYDWTK